MLAFQVIKAELRRNIKNKRILIIIVTFFCFFITIFFSSIKSMEAKQYEEKLNIPFIYQVCRSNFLSLEYEIQHTPADKERPTLRAEYEFWKGLNKNYEDWVYSYTQPFYYDWDVPVESMRNFNKILYEGAQSKVYKDEFVNQGYTKAKTKNNIKYYNYFLDHQIHPYTNDYEPNLANFITLLFKENTFFLLIIILCIFTIQSLCNDYDTQTYKIQFSNPIPRNRFVLAKITSSFCLSVISLIIAFALFSFIPMMQYGIGSFQYIYQIGAHLSTYLEILPLCLLLGGLTIAVYLCITYLVTLFNNQFSSALIGVGAIMVIVYFLLRLFGTSNVLAYIPLFYIHPFNIAMNDFSINYWYCVALSIITILILLSICAAIIKRKDLKGSDLS